MPGRERSECIACLWRLRPTKAALSHLAPTFSPWLSIDTGGDRLERFDRIKGMRAPTGNPVGDPPAWGDGSRLLAEMPWIRRGWGAHGRARWNIQSRPWPALGRGPRMGTARGRSGQWGWSRRNASSWRSPTGAPPPSTFPQRRRHPGRALRPKRSRGTERGPPPPRRGLPAVGHHRLVAGAGRGAEHRGARPGRAGAGGDLLIAPATPADRPGPGGVNSPPHRPAASEALLPGHPDPSRRHHRREPARRRRRLRRRAGWPGDAGPRPEPFRAGPGPFLGCGQPVRRGRARERGPDAP